MASLSDLFEMWGAPQHRRHRAATAVLLASWAGLTACTEPSSAPATLSDSQQTIEPANGATSDQQSVATTEGTSSGPFAATDSATASPAGDAVADPESPARDGGSNEPPSTGGSAVSGRVIDFWGHGLPSVEVDIAGVQTMTDADGGFAFDDVQPEYDVSLVIHLVGEIVEVYGWKFEGLTRREPTLQVYKGLPQRQAAVTVEAVGVDLARPSYGVIAVGGQHGHRSFSATGHLETSIVWRGPEQVDAPVHALSWSVRAVGDNRVPVDYLAHQSTRLAVSETMPSATPSAGPGGNILSVDLTPQSQAIDSAPVAGDVFGGAGEARIHSMFARFSDGPTLILVNDPQSATDAATFDYPAPRLDGMSLTMAASEGTGSLSTAYAIAYASQLTAGQSARLALHIPTPATALSPVDGSEGVDEATVFTWQSSEQTFVVSIEDTAVYQGMYVVTAHPQTTLPDFSELGLYYRNNGAYTWTVESHGTAATVDELAGPDGFLDPFSGDLRMPLGPRTGQGHFSRARASGFRLKK